ncbi:DUF3221 domain-containing protein [Cytobacillus sp.]|uniref:DUF3221 domain-containing protein n=1 Tax=Cytobacillus sp. TaxID=2675269 RepID=UPI0035129AB4
MGKYKTLAVLLGSGFILSACVTGEVQHQSAANPSEQTQSVTKNDSGWKTIETISGRNIIAKLDPAKETPDRDKVIKQIKESWEFKEGLYGPPSDDIAEELAVQQTEGEIALPLLYKTYGGKEGFDKEGVVFFENKSRGAAQSGLWIGVKNPDDRLKQFVKALQAEADAGVIKAESIFIYHTPHTAAENNQKMYEVNKAAVKFRNQHETPDRISLGISVDTISGEINIEHNFLTEEQKASLNEQFAGGKINFTQTGRLAPIGGEPDTIHPKNQYTDKYSQAGSYVMELSNNRMLAVAALPADFGKTGGDSDYFSATYFEFPDASKKLKVGQRVMVEASGPIRESYPGQGTALYVEVLPEYKPEGAELSESQVIKKALKTIKDQQGVAAVRDLSFNEELDEWSISFKQNEKNFEVKVNDHSEE